MNLKALMNSRLIPVLIGICLLPIAGIAGPEAQSDCRHALLMSRDAASTDNPIVVLIDELQKHPEDFYGKTVTVDGELHRTFTDNVFTIEGSGLIQDKDILVISTASKEETVVPLQHSLDSGKDVRITGLVLPYDRGRLECAYGPLHLESREGHSFTKMPVLIVDKSEPPKAAMPPVQLEKPVPAPPKPEAKTPEVTTPEPATPEPAKPEPSQAEAEKPSTLPKTAGELPLLAIVGLFAISGALLKSRLS